MTDYEKKQHDEVVTWRSVVFYACCLAAAMLFVTLIRMASWM